MPFEVSGEHRYYLEKHGTLEIEGIFSTEKITQLRTGLSAAFAERLGKSWSAASNQELFSHGRDLHIDSLEIRRLIVQRNLVTAIAELLGASSLRLGCNLYLPDSQVEDSYRIFFKEVEPLTVKFCLDGIVGALLVCIGPGALGDQAPRKVGDALLMRASHPFCLNTLCPEGCGEYFMITYTTQKALYVPNTRDPHLAFLKRYGYGYGDRLKEPYYPVVYR